MNQKCDRPALARASLAFACFGLAKISAIVWEWKCEHRGSAISKNDGTVLLGKVRSPAITDRSDSVKLPLSFCLITVRRRRVLAQEKE
jgi:hypothetical protein